MPAFRNSRLAGAALAALLVATAASAQVGPPVRIGPPGAPPPPPPYGAPPPASPYSPPPRSSGITIDQLAPPSPDAAGVLGAGNRGLPEPLWRGTARAVVQALLPKIGATSSPALQDLAYRLLATSAAPPVGPGEGSLLALRAERLTNALGRPDTALALLQSLPSAQGSEDLAKISVDLAFLAGDTRSACATVRARDKSWRSPYWDQGLVACQAIDGDGAGAQLGLDILREAKVKDEGFASLVERAVGNDSRLPDALPSPQPIALALLNKANLPLPKKAFDSARLPVLVAVATGPGFPAEQRAAAAEKAAAFGALAPELLAEAYLAMPLDDDDLANPLSKADSAGGTKGRAILFRAAHDAAVPLAKANMLQALLAKTPRADLYPAVLRAARPLLLELPVSPELRPVAADMAHALYALDQPGEAAQWLSLAGPEGAAVLPLAHVAAGATAPEWTETALTDLVGGSKKDPSLGLKRASLLVQLLAAEGAPAPDALVLPLMDQRIGGPGSLGPGLMIESEAAGKHLGGTILTSLAALGDEGAGGPSLTVAQAIAGLRAVGLTDEARHLAIDAAVAAGL